MAESETLHCEKGNHDWTREKKRGKKPKNCPDHTPQPTPALDPEERIRRQQEGRRAKQAERDAEGVAAVLEWREYNKADAAAWARYRRGEITREEWQREKPPLVKTPDQSAWDAAERAGLLKWQLDTADDSD